MILPKETRKLIHEANGRPVQIEWPQGGPEPKPGHIYTIQSSGRRAGASWMALRSIDRVDDLALIVTVQIEDDASHSRASKARRPMSETAPLNTVEEHTEYEYERMDLEADTLAELRAGSEKIRAVGLTEEKIDECEHKIRKRRKKGKRTTFEEQELERHKRRLREGKEGTADVATWAPLPPSRLDPCTKHKDCVAPVTPEGETCRSCGERETPGLPRLERLRISSPSNSDDDKPAPVGAG
jgi:hypothetical protein